MRAGMFSRYNSDIDPDYGYSIPDYSGTFLERSYDHPLGFAFTTGVSVGYNGVTASAFYLANVQKGTVAGVLKGDDLSFDISVWASRQGTYQPYQGVWEPVPGQRYWNEYYYQYPDYLIEANAYLKCELKIVSDGPFTYRSNRPLNLSSGANTQDIPEDADYSQTCTAGTYYVDFSVQTDYSGTPMTNSVNAWFRLTKTSVGAPQIASFRKLTRRFSIDWNDEWDRAVRIQRSSSLSSTNWETIGFGAIGQKSFVDSNAPTGSAFYRLVW